MLRSYYFILQPEAKEVSGCSSRFASCSFACAVLWVRGLLQVDAYPARRLLSACRSLWCALYKPPRPQGWWGCVHSCTRMTRCCSFFTLRSHAAAINHNDAGSSRYRTALRRSRPRRFAALQFRELHLLERSRRPIAK